MLWNTLVLALRSIQRNLLRSFLTVLGIVIGVSAVITMVTLGSGATQAVQNQISSLGTNLLMIRPGQRMGPGGGGATAPPFKDSDVDLIKSQISGITAVAPEARAAVTLVAGGQNWSSSVVGSSNDWLHTGNWELAAGRSFTDGELRAGAAVCIIGATIQRQLYAGGDPVGQQLRVKQMPCQVIGLFKSKGQGSFGQDQDEVVLMPLKTLQRRITGNTNVNSLLVSLDPASDAERVKNGLTQLLREARKLADTDDDNFNVLDTKQLADTLSGTTRVMTTLLGAVAAVSLLVGGIGVMNIMLVSVTERIREIGLRKALGAKPDTIRTQFLMEAATLGLLGGFLGLGIAAIGAAVLPDLIDQPVELVWWAVAGSLAVAVGVGLVAGVYPAGRAAKLAPIDALRHE